MGKSGSVPPLIARWAALPQRAEMHPVQPTHPDRDGRIRDPRVAVGFQVRVAQGLPGRFIVTELVFGQRDAWPFPECIREVCQPVEAVFHLPEPDSRERADPEVPLPPGEGSRIFRQRLHDPGPAGIVGRREQDQAGVRDLIFHIVEGGARASRAR